MKPFPKLKQIKSRQEPMYQHGYVGGSHHDDLWFRETHYPGIRPVIRHDKHYGPTVYMPPQQETFNDSTSDCKVMWLTPLTAKIDCWTWLWLSLPLICMDGDSMFIVFLIDWTCAVLSWVRMMWRSPWTPLAWDLVSSAEPTFAWPECCLIVPSSDLEDYGHVLIIFGMSDSFADCNQSVGIAFVSILEVSFRDDDVFTTIWSRLPMYSTSIIWTKKRSPKWDIAHVSGIRICQWSDIRMFYAEATASDDIMCLKVPSILFF